MRNVLSHPVLCAPGFFIFIFVSEERFLLRSQSA